MAHMPNVLKFWVGMWRLSRGLGALACWGVGGDPGVWINYRRWELVVEGEIVEFKCEGI